MKDIIKKEKTGFTLIEMVIYIGLLSIFLAILTNILTTSLNVQINAEAGSGVMQDGNYLLNRMNYDIKRSDIILLPSSFGVSTNSLEIDIGGNDYTYSLSNGNLLLTSPQGSNQLNSAQTKITNLSFKRIGNGNNGDTIVIDFTLESLYNQYNPEIQSFHTTIQRGL